MLYSHTLILSRSKQDRGGNTVFLPSKNTVFLSSPLVTDPDVSPSAGEGGRGSTVVDSEGGDPLPAAPLSLAKRRRRRSSDPFVVACGRIRPPASYLTTSRRPSGISSFETSLALLPQLATSLHVHHFLPLSPSRSDGPTSPIFFLLLLEVKLLHGVESCTPSVRKYLSLKWMYIDVF